MNITLIITSLLIIPLSCSKNQETESFIKENRIYLDSVDFQDNKANYSLNFIEVNIKPNQGLFEILIKLNVSAYEALEIINILRFNIDLKKLKPSQIIKIKLDQLNEVQSFQYQENITLKHKIKKDINGSFYYYKQQLPLIKKYRLIKGILTENSSLNNALLNQNIQKPLIATINNIVSSKIDMRYKSLPNDQYQILVEDFWYQNEWIDGTVLFVKYKGKRTKSETFFKYSDYDKESSYNGYYDSNAQSLVANALRFPVKKFRISSRYGMRIHPMTGKKQKHNGIDYISPFNSNVHAVAKGVVITSKYNNLSGNYITIKHVDNTTSYYLHLHHRYVKRGEIVKSNQTIGTVGNTGLVTGVHLHLGFKNKSGHWVNPESKKMISTPRLKSNRLHQFKNQIQNIYNIIKLFKDNSQ